MFTSPQLLRTWREQRPSNEVDLYSSVTGRLWESVTRGGAVSGFILYRSVWLLLGCILNGTLCTLLAVPFFLHPAKGSSIVYWNGSSSLFSHSASWGCMKSVEFSFRHTLSDTMTVSLVLFLCRCRKHFLMLFLLTTQTLTLDKCFVLT
jgi:hypothetical protein